MRITVTGAAGFIGRNLVRRLLAQGHQVNAMTRDGRVIAGVDSAEFGDRLKIFSGDVTDPNCLSGQLSHCDAVIHLAGLTLARARHEFFRINRDGTTNVVRSCAAIDPSPRLVYMSSLAAAGPVRGSKAVSEGVAPVPVSQYGASKLAAEETLREWADQLEIVVARPASVFGPEDRYMLPLFKYAMKGLVVVPGDRNATYSLMHVEDLADALELISSSTRVTCLVARPGDSKLRESGVYFCAQPPAMTFTQVAEIVAAAMERRAVRTICMPRVGCRTAGLVNSAVARVTPLRPLLNVDKMREALAGSWMCDTSKLTDELCFQFRTPLEQRIRQTAEAYREAGKL